MSHSLVEIPLEKWEVLLNLYNKRKRDPSAYSSILNYINWFKKDSTINVKIYSLDGDWETDGLFVIIDYDLDNLVIFNILSENFERLTTALNCLDPKSKFLFFAVQKRNIPAVKDHFKHVKLNEDDVRSDDTLLHHIEREEALAFDIQPPPGITLSSLEPHHAETVNAIWPHRTPGSINFVTRLITFNDSVGAFDDKGNLVAWCLRLPFGGMGLLQVVDSHKRQGLGNLMVRYLSHLIASKNEEVTAPVVIPNSASRSMFAKLGFKIVDEAIWILRPPVA